jgi:rhomboid protease GluP
MPQLSVHRPLETSLNRLTHSPVRAVPVTVALIAANLLVFVLMARVQWATWSLTHTDPLAWGANFGPATLDGQWWRLVSAAFVHFGLIHVSVNMWALWDVGRLLERVLGRWRYALLYLGAGAVGNLLSLAVLGNARVTGGASGAIFGLYGALLVFLWRERRQIDPDEFRRLFTVALAFSSADADAGLFYSCHRQRSPCGRLSGRCPAGHPVGATLAARQPADAPAGALGRRSGRAWPAGHGCQRLAAALPLPG